MNKLFVAALLSLAACSQTDSNNTTDTIIPPGSILTDYEDSDLQKAVVKSGESILQEGDVFNGKMQGVWISYYSDGKINTITSYHLGIKQGVEIQMDNSGYINSQSPYVNGKLEGEYKAYNRGRIIELKNYQDGQPNGVIQKYYANGKIMEESNYVNGTIDGEARWYDQEGNISIKYVYDMGKLVDDGSSSTE